jgi:hypothetical protein
MTTGTNWKCEACGGNQIAEINESTVTALKVIAIDFENQDLTYGAMDTDFNNSSISYECWDCQRQIKNGDLLIRNFDELYAYLSFLQD